MLTAEIDVVKGKTVTDVVVDVTSGKVRSAEDKENRDKHSGKHAMHD